MTATARSPPDSEVRKRDRQLLRPDLPAPGGPDSIFTEPSFASESEMSDPD